MELTDRDLDNILTALDFADKNYTFESNRFGELKRKIEKVREPYIDRDEVYKYKRGKKIA